MLPVTLLSIFIKRHLTQTALYLPLSIQTQTATVARTVARMGLSVDLLPSFSLADEWVTDAKADAVPPLPMAKGSQLDLLDIAPSGEWGNKGGYGGITPRQPTLIILTPSSP